MSEGLIKELKGDYIGAVRAYEQVLAMNDKPELEIFINLSFLYWEFATEQIEFNIPNKIPDEWSLIGGQKFPIVLDRAIRLYPASLELAFWEKYFQYRLYGELFSEQDCIVLIEKYKSDTTLIPYFYLYMFNKKKYALQRNALIEVCKRKLTAKNKYILGFGD